MVDINPQISPLHLNTKPEQVHSRKIETKIYQIFLAITIGAMIINAFYVAFVSKHEQSTWISIIGYVSNFTDSVLALYFAAKILLIESSFYKALWLSIFFYIILLLFAATGFSIIFFSIGFFIFVLMLKIIGVTYEIGVLKTLFLLLIQLILVILINFTVFLFSGFLKFFA